MFVHDRQTGETTRVSVSNDGTQANDESVDFPSVSEDGRFVVFESKASNLASDDTNGYGDVFIHDRQTGETKRISISSEGTQGNERSYDPFISANGRYVTFESEASNLVNDDTNGYGEVFVHDRLTGVTTRVSISSSGVQGMRNLTIHLSLLTEIMWFLVLGPITWSAVISIIFGIFRPTPPDMGKQGAYQWQIMEIRQIMIPDSQQFQLMDIMWFLLPKPPTWLVRIPMAFLMSISATCSLQMLQLATPLPSPIQDVVTTQPPHRPAHPVVRRVIF